MLTPFEKAIRLTARVVHSIFRCSFFLPGVSFIVMSSFVVDHGTASRKHAVSDTLDAKGFQTLFNGGNYDPAKPYLFQLNPRAVAFVDKYISTQGEELERMKVWGRPYLDLYDNVLLQEGLPVEIKYLSVIESHLEKGLRSGAGAVGPWQIMPDEAKRFGLKVGGGIDERKDYIKSTHVAAKLLKELYARYHDWLLVIAAYNCGAGRVHWAITKAGSRNFWDLQTYLPEETRNHVKKFIGTHYIFEGGGGWTTMTAQETALNKAAMQTMALPGLNDEDLKSSSVVTISGHYNANVLINTVHIEYALFNRYNPKFQQTLASGREYQLRLPNDKLVLFQEKREDILQQSVKLLMTAGTKS